jgi:hypothetical protein
MLKMFFSEEKNQKTLTFSAAPNHPAKSRICKPAQNQKSFGSFLQKRPASCYYFKIISTRRFCGSRTPLAVGTSGLLSP